ncbi:MAG: crossover junction endodeoxyribonuclease RuvC [Proteobacteria bacterium]|nr:crossover junction endodeoxyribonuclease RuvC [Pseudomonadota bacterium]
MKVMGVDPGLAHTGVAVVEGTLGAVTSFSYGTIVTKPPQPDATRLYSIHERISSILAEEKPVLLVLEEVYSLPRYPKSGLVLGKVLGAIMVACCRAGVPVREVAVREAKQVLTGNGAASKAQLERAVRDHLALDRPITPSHASDAVALALIGLFRYAPAACRNEGKP